ncbi:hypothetical protein Bca52824_023186 [Brassica carinata]|uniref:Uncharacterized protein n=1 Tax=Brassica carinata TaxID=52824 RepID=A0A8X7VI14_BRACI|nr:hypothetical protein Bca52824_023186 [Brassica carinata]
MANSYTVLADLRAGRCSNVAEVRLLRFWEAKNINKRGQLMSLEMLLIDEQVMRVMDDTLHQALDLRHTSIRSLDSTGEFTTLQLGNRVICRGGNKSSWHLSVFAMTANVIQTTNEQFMKCGMDGYQNPLMQDIYTG